MPKKLKLKYNRYGQLTSWSLRNQLKIAIQEAVDELPIRDDIPNDNLKSKNISKKTVSNDCHRGFESRCIL